MDLFRGHTSFIPQLESWVTGVDSCEQPPLFQLTGEMKVMKTADGNLGDHLERQGEKKIDRKVNPLFSNLLATPPPKKTESIPGRRVYLSSTPMMDNSSASILLKAAKKTLASHCQTSKMD
jgi:hypothetical protein